MSSVVTVLDGHQMAKQGRAGAALCIAALGSFFAGTTATLVIAAFAPPLADLRAEVRPCRGDISPDGAGPDFRHRSRSWISAQGRADDHPRPALGMIGTPTSIRVRRRFSFDRPGDRRHRLRGDDHAGLFAFAEITPDQPGALRLCTNRRQPDQARSGSPGRSSSRRFRPSCVAP